MPIFEITQRLYYEASELERMLEKSLAQYGQSLPQPATIGKKFEHIRDGLRREFERGNKSLAYIKFFGDQTEFIAKFEGDPLENYYINEANLIQIINTNALYSQDIKLTDDAVDVSLVHYPWFKKETKYEIDFNEKASIHLFVQVLNNFYKTSIDDELLQDRLNMDSTGIIEMGSIIQQIAPHIYTPTIKDYVNMMVKYVID
jgi:hypothetical protein